MVNAELKDVIKDIHGLQVSSHPDPSLLLILCARCQHCGVSVVWVRTAL